MASEQLEDSEGAEPHGGSSRRCRDLSYTGSSKLCGLQSMDESTRYAQTKYVHPRRLIRPKKKYRST